MHDFFTSFYNIRTCQLHFQGSRIERKTEVLPCFFRFVEEIQKMASFDVQLNAFVPDKQHERFLNPCYDVTQKLTRMKYLLKLSRLVETTSEKNHFLNELIKELAW